MKCDSCLFFDKKWLEGRRTTWCYRQGSQKEVAIEDSCENGIIKSSKKVKVLEKQELLIQEAEKMVATNRLKSKIDYTNKKRYLDGIIDYVTNHHIQFKAKDRGIIVYTATDTWFLEISNQGVKLYHENKNFSDGFHEQRSARYTDIEKLFAYLKSHNDFNISHREKYMYQTK